MIGLSAKGLLIRLQTETQKGGTKSKLASGNSKRKPPSREMRKGKILPLIYVEAV